MQDPSPRPAPPHGPPWSGPPWSPPSRRGPSWPVALIVSAVIIAGSAVAVALIVTRSHPGPTAAGPPASAAATPPSTKTEDADSSSCQAWPGTKAALLAIPQLPDGWDWDTPNVDTYIQTRTAAIAKALDLFEPQIAPQPANVAAAAHQYVASRRNEIRLLRGHTYTEADGVPVVAGETKLDQLCHVTDHT